MHLCFKLVVLCTFVSSCSSFLTVSRHPIAYRVVSEGRCAWMPSNSRFNIHFKQESRLANLYASPIPKNNSPPTPPFRRTVRQRLISSLTKMMKSLNRLGRSFLALMGRLAARLPTRVLRILIGGFVKELKARKLSLEELHYVLMDQLSLEDFYRLAINERSLNLTATEYGGIVNFLDAKAKLEASKILPGLDRNKDGQVSPEEVLQLVTETMSSKISGAIDSLDADGDGRLTPSDILHLVSDRLRDDLFQLKKNPPGNPPRS